MKKKIEERKKEEDIIDLIGWKKMEGNKIALSNRRFYRSFRSPVAMFFLGYAHIKNLQAIKSGGSIS